MSFLDRAKLASLAKGGQYGNARDGAITPRRFLGLGLGSNKFTSDLGLHVVVNEEPAELAVTDVAYNRSNREFTITKAPVSGGGGSALYFGTVMGGNSTTVREPTKNPTGASSIALPVPYFNADGALSPFNMPDVADWADYPDNMEDYAAYGSALPVLPDGLCYVRLERPYTLLGKSWAAGYPIDITLQYTDKPLAVVAAVNGSDLSKVLVYFDTAPATFGGKSYFKVRNIATGALVPVSSASINSNVVTLNLQQELDSASSYSVSVLARAVRNGAGVSGYAYRYNDSALLDAAFDFLSGSLVICINRVASQTFYAGDLVSLQNTGLTITDSAPAGAPLTKAVAEILSNATNARSPHTHIVSEFGADGGMGSMV